MTTVTLVGYACRLRCVVNKSAFSHVTTLAPASWTDPGVTFGAHYRGPRTVPSGLRYCENFVDASEEADLLRVLDGEGAQWQRHIRRAQQFFGLVYYQTSQHIPELQPTADSPVSEQYGRDLGELPAWLLPRVLSTGIYREGVNQVQANEYLADSGIGVHVEDPAAGPAFATLSLLQPVQLTLSSARNGRPLPKDERDREDCVKVLLEPRSFLVLQGESRESFAHAIRQSRLVHLRDGGVLRRDASYRRVSLTFRGIVEQQRSSQRLDMPSGYKTYSVPSASPANSMPAKSE